MVPRSLRGWRRRRVLIIVSLLMGFCLLWVLLETLLLRGVNCELLEQSSIGVREISQALALPEEQQANRLLL